MIEHFGSVLVKFSVCKRLVIVTIVTGLLYSSLKISLNYGTETNALYRPCRRGSGQNFEILLSGYIICTIWSWLDAPDLDFEVLHRQMIVTFYSLYPWCIEPAPNSAYNIA